MSRIIRLTESDITNIVKKVLNESNSFGEEPWVRGNDPIGYWKILFNVLKTGGVGVKWEVVNDPVKSTFMYWGGWVIWKDVNTNGGYPVSFNDSVTKVSMTFEFKGSSIFNSNYAGQPLNNIILYPKFIDSEFNLGVFAKISNKQMSDTILKYQKSNPFNASVNLIYDQIVESVAGGGTDPNKLLNAVKKLENADEFKYLLTLFKDKKTGYSDFFEMINQEYDAFNTQDVANLITVLNNINVFTTANFSKTNVGLEVFMGYYRFNGSGYGTKTPESVMNSCKSSWNKILPTSIKWWKDWLSNPITKEKVYKNYLEIPRYGVWNSGIKEYEIKNEINNAFIKYFELLNKIKLNFYDKTTLKLNNHYVRHDAGAFVFKGDNNIYVNCSSNGALSDEYIDTNLIHEIQHLIYNIKPLNPEKQIGSSFDGTNCTYQSRGGIINNISSKTTNTSTNYSSDIIRASKTLGIDPKYLYWLEEDKKERGIPGDPGYFCRETEKMSNIMGIRRLFGIQPGGKITLNMLKPYIIGDKTSVDVEFILYCWIENKYPDFNQMLNDFNKLALNKNGAGKKNKEKELEDLKKAPEPNVT